MWHAIRYILPGAVNTIVLTGVSFAVGVVLAIPVTLGGRSTFLPLRALVKAVVELVRSIPVLVWLFIVFFGLPQEGPTPLPPVATIITLSVVSPFTSRRSTGGASRRLIADSGRLAMPLALAE